MDLLKDYHVLLVLIGTFLLLVVLLPFVRWEIRKLRRAKLLANQVIPISSLSEEDIAKIESRHPSGKKMYPSVNRGHCVGCGTCVLSCEKKKTLALISGKSTLLDPRICDACGHCEKACPTGANQLIEYGQKLKVRVPQIDENFETNIPGIYIIGTLAGAGLIKESINQGRAVLNAIMRDVFPDRLPHIVIVGAGPAGLSAFLSSRKFGVPATCLEKDATANTIRNFPKKKFVMAEPLDMPLVGPIWVGDTTREKLLEVWDRILEKTEVPIITGAKLDAVRKEGERFIVSAGGQEIPCDKVILALGTRGEPRKLKVPGENLPKVFFQLLDAQEFRGRAITVVGGGDASLEASLALVSQGCRVTLIVRGEGFPLAKARNREKIDAAVKQNTVTVRFQSAVREIKPKSVVVASGDRVDEIENDFVFVMIGGELPFPLLEKIGIRIVEKTL